MRIRRAFVLGAALAAILSAEASAEAQAPSRGEAAPHAAPPYTPQPYSPLPYAPRPYAQQPYTPPPYAAPYPPAPYAPPYASPLQSPPPFDPVLPAAITTMATGGSAGLLGLLTGGSSWGIPLGLGGATTLTGGLTLLIAAGEESPAHADAGVARVAAGGMVLSIGAGLAVAGAFAAGLDEGNRNAKFMVAAGVATSVVATPFIAWGAVTWEDDRGVRYASARRFMSGCVLTSLGVVTTASGVMAASWSSNAAWSSDGTALFSVPVLLLGAAGIGAGVPLMATGADVIDERYVVPQLALGAGSVQATWRLR